MRSLDYAVGAGVVAGDANVIDVVLFGEMGECFDEGWSVVGDDFDEGAPSAEDVFEDPVGERSAGLMTKHAKFGVVRYRAATLD